MEDMLMWFARGVLFSIVTLTCLHGLGAETWLEKGVLLLCFIWAVVVILILVGLMLLAFPDVIHIR